PGWPARPAGTCPLPPSLRPRWARPGSAPSACSPSSRCSGSWASNRPPFWGKKPGAPTPPNAPPVGGKNPPPPKRTIPAATYAALGMIAIVYAAASWAMAAHAGTGHVVAAATAQGPGLLFGLSGSTGLSQAAQLVFVTSLFAAALSFHN